MAKEYRVVCSQEEKTERIFIDIVPAGGAIHELVLFARQRLNRARNHYEVKDIGKSISLSENENNLQIDFRSFDKVSPNDPKYTRLQILKDKLRPLIVEQFRKMQKQGINTTINVSSPVLLEEFYSASHEPKVAQIQKHGKALESRIIERLHYQQKNLSQKEEPLERYRRLYYDGYC